jgi:hypothetical protein
MLAFKGLIAAFSGAVATWLTATGPEPSTSLYFVVARGSGKCLQQVGATMNNGDRVTQSTCINRPNFKVRKLDYGDGTFSLQFAHSHKCVNLSGALLEDILLGSVENGAALQQWDCLDRPNARWREKIASDNYVYLVSAASNTKCMSLNAGARSDGEAVTLWDCARRPDMMWKLVPVREEPRT